MTASLLLNAKLKRRNLEECVIRRKCLWLLSDSLLSVGRCNLGHGHTNLLSDLFSHPLRKLLSLYLD